MKPDSLKYILILLLIIGSCKGDINNLKIKSAVRTYDVHVKNGNSYEKGSQCIHCDMDYIIEDTLADYSLLVMQVKGVSKNKFKKIGDEVYFTDNENYFRINTKIIKRGKLYILTYFPKNAIRLTLIDDKYNIITDFELTDNIEKEIRIPGNF